VPGVRRIRFGNHASSGRRDNGQICECHGGERAPGTGACWGRSLVEARAPGGVYARIVTRIGGLAQFGREQRPSRYGCDGRLGWIRRYAGRTGNAAVSGRNP